METVIKKAEKEFGKDNVITGTNSFYISKKLQSKDFIKNLAEEENINLNTLSLRNCETGEWFDLYEIYW